MVHTHSSISGPCGGDGAVTEQATDEATTQRSQTPTTATTGHSEQRQLRVMDEDEELMVVDNSPVDVTADYVELQRQRRHSQLDGGEPPSTSGDEERPLLVAASNGPVVAGAMGTGRRKRMVSECRDPNPISIKLIKTKKITQKRKKN